ncbi:fatty acid desaturase [Umezawaea tangerina]|uniref:Beta-carotene hydroxylase n=1 Tax=Umezawaea tangerina TaxID=84725 RepID=A0A2T0TFM6_9PSEU|nr:fatty acid desaturase [Umezawaea tangerina]PRY44470.1 beta-carotene hydroxylase [Umezawaea tangerina]
MKPSLAELGTDLLATDRRRRLIALARPPVGVAVFALTAWWADSTPWAWWLTPVVVFGIFVAVVTVTHDVVHRSIGLGRKGTEWALFLCGLVLLESGHAYRATHEQHHRIFPHEDDPEGYPANLSLVGAVLYGPVFLVGLWRWAFRRAAGDRVQRTWLLVEACAPFLALGGGALLWSRTPALLVYAVMAVVGSWVYPLLTVYLPHHDYGDTPLTQTRTLRGRIIPAMFLELTYHLEHHLYPSVPSHHLAELGRRLDPFLAGEGVRPHRVP